MVSVEVLFTALANIALTSAGWSHAPDDGTNVLLNGNSTSTESLNNNLKNIAMESELPLNL